MNKRFLGVLIFAFMVATAGGLITYRSLVNRPMPARNAPIPTVRVVLAAHDLQLGKVLKEEDVRVADWPGSPPAGAAAKLEDVIGRGVTTAMYEKEPVLETRLAPKGAGGGLAAMIPPGMRAVAVRVNEVVGVAGFVVPGMRVDVLISANPPNGSKDLGTVTKTLLQNIEVLSAGQDFKKDAEGKPVVVQVINLLVTPAQAEELSLASNQTTIQLVLRNPMDRQVAKTSGTAVGLLFGGNRMGMPGTQPVVRKAVMRPVAAPVVKRDTPFVMEIISGTKKTQSKFENTGEAK